MPTGAEDHVVEHFDLEQLPGADQVARHFDVGFRWRRIAAGMVVLCAARTYVQRQDDTSWDKPV